MITHLYTYDLPDDFICGDEVAIDTETMGLCPNRDRLCLIQISNGDGVSHLVNFPEKNFSKSKNLINLLKDNSVNKIFHFGRFDLAVIIKSFEIIPSNVFCTKIASKISRTYTSRHSLSDLCKEILGIELDKANQSSDWGRAVLTAEQLNYAGSDVLYLHSLKSKLIELLEREKKRKLANACFNFLPFRALMDLEVSDSYDVFMH